MKTFDPKDHPVPLIHQLLLSGVAPRPIALVSTLDAEGRTNLSPFSFFNAFGANPPVVVVSPSYRGTTGAPKHTFLNAIATREFTVSAVSHAMVEQANLASAEYPPGVDEFVMAGFSKLPSREVAPPGVAESPFIMECRLVRHIDTGGRPGSGNLLMGEVVLFHVRESAYTGERIDPDKLDLVARMGYDWYCRASGAALFALPKPIRPGIGIEALPGHVRASTVYDRNDLVRFASAETLPDRDAVFARWREEFRSFAAGAAAESFDAEIRAGHPDAARRCAVAEYLRGHGDAHAFSIRLERCARRFLAAGETALAWECALVAAPGAAEVLFPPP